MTEDFENAVSLDGHKYSAKYLAAFNQAFGAYPFKVSQFCGDDWEAMGLFHYLLEDWPKTCLEEPPGSQVSAWFPGIFAQNELRAKLNDKAQRAIPVLQRLENYGVLWLVRKGGEIEYLELRMPE